MTCQGFNGNGLMSAKKAMYRVETCGDFVLSYLPQIGLHIKKQPKKKTQLIGWLAFWDTTI